MKTRLPDKNSDYALDEALKTLDFLSSVIAKQLKAIQKLRAENREINGMLRLALDMLKAGSKGVN